MAAPPWSTIPPPLLPSTFPTPLRQHHHTAHTLSTSSFRSHRLDQYRHCRSWQPPLPPP
ncbi:putative formin-like protein 3 isoform X1 [Iris pallida]|uniref:Formin-like protein 3 isoform X1 n=1 Tax=Iris pallida TaxID=29817 RepID=A0AAX6GT84_IRIPA|nr:putative formin-like protein 3 isoform X1 [Iris pallida]KAJ6831547.1 putative formin-like protein 3 isoform X1 [Iris pallida]